MQILLSFLEQQPVKLFLSMSQIQFFFLFIKKISIIRNSFSKRTGILAEFLFSVNAMIKRCVDGRKHWQGTRFNMDNTCYCLFILSNLVLHRRRYHVDLSYGDRLESELRYLQQAMATEAEKEKEFYLANDPAELSPWALFRPYWQLFVFQRGYHR